MEFLAIFSTDSEVGVAVAQFPLQEVGGAYILFVFNTHAGLTLAPPRVVAAFMLFGAHCTFNVVYSI